MFSMKTRRVGRILMYACLTASGGYAIFQPADAIQDNASRYTVFLWALAMMLSSAAALVGNLVDLWLGEFAALPLLATVIAFLGVAVLRSPDDKGVIYAVVGLVILAFSFGLIARWRDLYSLVKENKDSVANDKE